MPNLIPPKIPDGEKVDFDVGEAFPVFAKGSVKHFTVSSDCMWK